MPIKFINGCSNEVKRNALSDICPNEEKPIGETKYKIKSLIVMPVLYTIIVVAKMLNLKK